MGSDLDSVSYSAPSASHLTSSGLHLLFKAKGKKTHLLICCLKDYGMLYGGTVLAHCGVFQKCATSPKTTTVKGKNQDITLHVQSALCQ